MTSLPSERGGRALARLAPTVAFLLLGGIPCAAWDAQSGFPVLSSRDLPAFEGPAWAFDTFSANLGGPGNSLFIGADKVIGFDGKELTKFPVPGGYAVRAVAASTHGARRLWVGAIGELGYFEANDSNAPEGWTYRSLLPSLSAAGSPPPKEFWDAVATSEGVYFAAADQVIRFEPDAVPATSHPSVWHLPCEPRLIPMHVNGALWLYQAGVGVLKMMRAGPEVVWSDPDLPDRPVLWALEGPAELIGTGSGVYIRRNGEWRRMPAVSAAVGETQLSCAVWLSPPVFAFGTSSEGVVVARADDTVLGVVNRSTGLPDDHVQALWRDSADGLWIGTSGGFARMPDEGNTSIFDGRNGLGETPIVRVLEGPKPGDSCIVTTKRGYAQAQGKLIPLPGMVSLVQDAAESGGALWAAGFGGIWRLETGTKTWERIYFTPYSVQKLLPLSPSRLLFLESHNLKELLPSPHGGWAVHSLGPIGDEPISLVRDHAGDIWVSTRTQGILRFEVRPGMDTAGAEPGKHQTTLRLKIRYQNAHGLPAGLDRAHLSVAGTRLDAFSADGPIYRLRDDSARTGFVPAPGLEEFAGLAAAGDYWVVRRRDLPVPAVIKVSESGWSPVDVPGLDLIGQVDGVSLANGFLWISGKKALLRADLSAAGRFGPPPTCRLQRVGAPGEDHSFRFSSPEALRDPAIWYQVRMAGSAWSTTNTNVSTYQDLARGSYVFEVRALDRWGRAGPVASEAFVIPTPWWAARTAYVAYAVGLALVTVGWVRRRTQRRFAEIQRRNTELNHLVNERTRALEENRQMLETRSQELAMSNAAKSEFLETISHEIRNPLNGVRGLVDMLDERSLPESQRSIARSLAACAATLSRAFDEVLNFSRVESRQMPVKHAPFNLAGVIDEAVFLHAAAARQSGCELRIEGLAREQMDFVGDAEKIRTIVSNFVGNAVKYAPGHPVEVRVEIDREGSTTAADVTIEVRDHGPGIPPEEQSLVFNKFVRGREAKSNRVPGTGLGLATCRALSELMDGFVGLQSPSISLASGEPQAGTTFFLQLRLWLASESVVQEGWPKEKINGSLGGSAGRVLIVEDQDYNQRVACRIVGLLGFRADVASNGQEALEKIKSGPYDALLVDWELPGMKGDEIARHVRSLAWGDKAIIVATTGHDSDAVKQACLEGGMNAFIVKPYDTETIGRVLGVKPLFSTGNGADPDVFSLLGGGDPTRTARAAADFLESLQRELAGLTAAVDDRNRQKAARCAHRLRSLAGLVQADGLRNAARGVEDEIEKAGPEKIEDLRREIEREAAALRLRVEAGLPSLHPSQNR